MTWSRLFWIVWIAVGFFYEMWAIVNRQPGDTLSEQVWWARQNMSGEAFSLILFLLAGLAAWAVYHFAYQGD